MDTSLRTREERKKLYKYKVRNNEEKRIWAQWNTWFKCDLTEYERNDIWVNYEEDIMIDYGDCDCPICQPVSKSISFTTGYAPMKKTYPQEAPMSYGYNATANYATAIVAAPQPTTEEKQRDYLLSRLASIRSDIRDNERIAYGLEDDKPPKTIAERKQRFADGKYSVEWDYNDKDFKDEYSLPSYASSGRIVWRDPKKVKDETGFSDAMTKMEADSDATVDIIKIKSPDDGLTAVQDFAKKTYH